MAELAYIARMSVKGLGVQSGKEVPENEGVRVPVCRIMGVAHDIKVGESKDGQVWSALTGNFWGENLKTGDQYSSGKLFLPGGIHEMIESAVKEAQKNGGANSIVSVRFAFEITVVKSGNPIGYSYQAITLLPPSVTDDMAEIHRQISERSQKRIEAPESKPKPEPVPARAASGRK